MTNSLLMRKEEVLQYINLSSSTLYYLIDKGDFPKPIKIGKRTVAWFQEEIDRWINSRPRADIGRESA